VGWFIDLWIVSHSWEEKVVIHRGQWFAGNVGTWNSDGGIFGLEDTLEGKKICVVAIGEVSFVFIHEYIMP
jgi:hypothetical protein